MTLRVEVLDDGTTHYISDGPVVMTGTVVGAVELPDGTVVDVTPAVVEVDDEEQAMLLAQAIAEKES